MPTSQKSPRNSSTNSPEDSFKRSLRTALDATALRNPFFAVCVAVVSTAFFVRLPVTPAPIRPTALKVAPLIFSIKSSPPADRPPYAYSLNPSCPVLLTASPTEFPKTPAPNITVPTPGATRLSRNTEDCPTPAPASAKNCVTLPGEYFSAISDCHSPM